MEVPDHEARRSYVVTGGGRGVGRAIVEHLVRDGGSVVVIETDPDALSWFPEHAAATRLIAVIGDAADHATAEEAASCGPTSAR